MTRRAFENLIVSAEITNDSIHVYAVSDLLKKQVGNLDIVLYSLDGKTLWEKSIRVSVPANTSTVLWSGKLDRIIGNADRNNVVFNLRLHAKEHSHEGNFYLCKQAELRLSKPDIDYRIDHIDGGYSIELKSDKFVRALYLSLDGTDCHFDDNYFDLIPNKPKYCTIRTTIPLDEFKSKLKLKSLTL